MNNENNEITCQTARDHLTAFVDREPVSSAVIQHLTECPACLAAWNEQVALSQLFDTWQLGGADVWEAVESEIAFHSNPAWRNYLTAQELTHARSEARRTGRDMAQTMIDLGYATQREVSAATAVAQGLPFVDLTKHKPEAAAIEAIPAELARKHRILPVKKDGKVLWVASTVTPAIDALDEIRLASRCVVRPMLAVPSAFDFAFEKAYNPTPAAQEPEPTETSLILAELRAMRAEMTELRGEVAHLRRQVSALRGGSVPPRPETQQTRLFPFAPPSEPPVRFG